MAYGTHRISAVAKCLKNHRNRCLCLRVAQTQTAEGPSAHNPPSHDSNPSIRKVRPATPPHRILSCVVVVLSLSSTPWTSVHDAKFSKSGSDVTDFGPPRRRREIFQVHDRRHGLRSATRNFLSPGATSRTSVRRGGGAKFSTKVHDRRHGLRSATRNFLSPRSTSRTSVRHRRVHGGLGACCRVSRADARHRAESSGEKISRIGPTVWKCEPISWWPGLRPRVYHLPAQRNDAPRFDSSHSSARRARKKRRAMRARLACMPCAGYRLISSESLRFSAQVEKTPRGNK